MFNYFIEDIKRLNKAIDFQSSKKRYGILRKFNNIFLNSSFYLILLFRIASFLKRINIPILPNIITFLQSIIFCSSIHHSCKIGPGLLIPHGFCIVITGDAQIGTDAVIFHEVTIGGNATRNDGTPRIGNNVTIYAGAKILGPIKIGDNVRIGANSVVLNSVPDNALVVGNPARIIKDKEQEIEERI